MKSEPMKTKNNRDLSSHRHRRSISTTPVTNIQKKNQYEISIESLSLKISLLMVFQTSIDSLTRDGAEVIGTELLWRDFLGFYFLFVFISSMDFGGFELTWFDFMELSCLCIELISCLFWLHVLSRNAKFWFTWLWYQIIKFDLRFIKFDFKD